MATNYVLRYDGIERFAQGDAMPTTNKIICVQKPNDDRSPGFDTGLRAEDLIRYRVVNTVSEIWERKPGVFEGLTVVELERVASE